MKLTLQNIPIVNLRQEFIRSHRLVHRSDFARVLRRISQDSREIPLGGTICFRAFEDVATFLVQRAISGVESYLPSAVSLELSSRKKLTRAIFAKILNPFDLGGNGTVDNYYHRLPALVDSGFSLKHSEPTLWKQTKDFYADVRNPLFHGKELSSREVESVRSLFSHVEKLYQWIDGWETQHNFLKGARTLFRL